MGSGKFAQDIKNLFYLQDGRCYITGKKLILGVNAGLDHIEPRSQRPDLVGSLKNVRWVDKKINEIKRDLSYGEFIDICRMVVKVADGKTKLVDSV